MRNDRGTSEPNSTKTARRLLGHPPRWPSLLAGAAALPPPPIQRPRRRYRNPARWWPRRGLGPAGSSFFRRDAFSIGCAKPGDASHVT